MKQFITGGLAAVLMAGGLITAAPPAIAGCINPDWPGHHLHRCATTPSPMTACGHAA